MERQYYFRISIVADVAVGKVAKDKSKECCVHEMQRSFSAKKVLDFQGLFHFYSSKSLTNPLRT